MKHTANYIGFCLLIFSVMLAYESCSHRMEFERKRWYNIGFERAKSLNKFEVNTNCAKDYYPLDSLTMTLKLEGK